MLTGSELDRTLSYRLPTVVSSSTDGQLFLGEIEM